jgi:predicted lipoprotein with Yx(FWY)xxD motif
MTRARVALVAATAVAGPGLRAACGPGGNGTSAPEQQAPAANQAPTSGAGLVAADVGKLGKVVTAHGLTVYRFDKDTAKPSVSNRDGQCAVQWLPVIADSSTSVVQGIDNGLVGMVTRKEGTMQVTLNGWPLYRFAKDTAPGQANGQRVGGTWFAATPKARRQPRWLPLRRPLTPAAVVMATGRRELLPTGTKGDGR